MALQLLERDRSGGLRLAQALTRAMEGVGYCRQCRTLTEDELCPQCADPRRDDSLLCVVQSPVDVFAVEQTGFRGRYFVLKGHLSPLDGLGPEAIGIPELLGRVADGAFSEVIPQQTPLSKGSHRALHRTDAHSQRPDHQPNCPWCSTGRRAGLVDGGTLAHALAGRKPISL